VFPSADAQSERGGEEKEEEKGQGEDGEAEKEVKDETGSGENSPHHGEVFSNACFFINLRKFLMIKISIFMYSYRASKDTFYYYIYLNYYL